MREGKRVWRTPGPGRECTFPNKVGVASYEVKGEETRDEG